LEIYPVVNLKNESSQAVKLVIKQHFLVELEGNLQVETSDFLEVEKPLEGLEE
jgi:hypothetical protein